MIRAILIVSAAVLAAGCMEVEQSNVAAGKTPGQTVNRDTAAWNNEPLAGGPKWNKGDQTSWDEQIKKRQLVQNEYRRIDQ